MTIKPLLLATMGGLTGYEVSDGNRLFNVLERLGGTLGISLLATFFQLREQYHIGQVLSEFGIKAGNIGTSLGRSGSGSLLSSLPGAVHSQLSVAAVNGFHDTILVIVVSFVSLVLTTLLRNPNRRTNPSEERKDSW